MQERRDKSRLYFELPRHQIIETFKILDTIKTILIIFEFK